VEDEIGEVLAVVERSLGDEGPPRRGLVGGRRAVVEDLGAADVEGHAMSTPIEVDLVGDPLDAHQRGLGPRGRDGRRRDQAEPDRDDQDSADGAREREGERANGRTSGRAVDPRGGPGHPGGDRAA